MEPNLFYRVAAVGDLNEKLTDGQTDGWTTAQSVFDSSDSGAKKETFSFEIKVVVVITIQCFTWE